jgi:DNA-binding NarL/FixJ family response regulator
MSWKTVRVLIVDDHAVVREGYRALLEKQEGLKVVGEACDAASAYQCYKDKRPDVVIMDISMPGRGGIDAIEHIREFDAKRASSCSRCTPGPLMLCTPFVPGPKNTSPRAARRTFW